MIIEKFFFNFWINKIEPNISQPTGNWIENNIIEHRIGTKH